jgi:hypothetical protein
MLSLENKIENFKKYLEVKNDNYGDIMKDEIYSHFFENENSFDFLIELKNEKDIENKAEFIVSKMIMLEHQDGLSNIIHNHTLT